MKWLHVKEDVFTCIDDEDYEKLSKVCWNYCKGYASGMDYAAPINGKYRTAKSLHLFIHPPRSGLRVDHINRDKLDNRRCNLRYVTGRGNHLNVGIPDIQVIPTEEEKIQAVAHKKRLKKEIQDRTNTILNSNLPRRPVRDNFGRVYPSIEDAARKHGVSYQCINENLSGKTAYAKDVLKFWYVEGESKMGKKLATTPKSKVRAALRQLWLRSRERAAALKREGYCCEICKAKQSKAKGREIGLQVHHRDGIDWNGVIDLIFERIMVHPDKLQVLCEGCHAEHHDNEDGLLI